MTQMRNSLSHSDLIEKSSLIKENLFSSNEFNKAKKILFFMSLEKEVQTWDMICQSFQIGKKIHLPITVKNSPDLKIARIRDTNIDFVSGAYGIKEPGNGSYDFVDSHEIDLIVVPGLAFDDQGGRLGFGKGYYDRLFANGNPKTLRFGVALDFQMVASLPQSKNDRPVHLIATEKRVLFCNPIN
jgi:5-formyltetrahydrofolate cyclo-ligase